MEITLEKTIADKLDLRRVTNSSKKTLRKFNLRYEIRTIEGEPQRFALSRFAESLGHKEDAQTFAKRSLGYTHYYCKEFGTLRPILPDGSFYTPFDPLQGLNFEPAPGFHEGNAWNYTFYVPHDIDGLKRLMGGEKKFAAKLRKVFDENLYDPANEPDITYPYLFAQVKGEEWRTDSLVNSLLKKYFKNQPDGIPGNDDTGTMSAWAVFSMMGLYPD